MQARMPSPVQLIPAAMKGLYAYSVSANEHGVPATTIHLVHLRASQINGCGVCVELHAKDMRKEGESDERIFTVSAWQDAPYFTAAERAALALTEAVTRVADRSDPVSDEVWAEAARHYDEEGLAALLIAISTINVWTRLNVATRQVAGAWQAS
jgi:AhpD family alkylhydroperoxidase